MKKINKSAKSGFTLVEMVLVVAIIVILASVLLIGLTSYLEYANKSSSEVLAQGDVYDRVQSDIRATVRG